MIPNSLIWYDVGKYERLGSPNFESFEDMISFTKQYSSFDNPLWCMDIESGASTGWIATNWLEELILHEYGPDTYDDWLTQRIKSQNNEITLSIFGNDSANCSLFSLDCCLTRSMFDQSI